MARSKKTTSIGQRDVFTSPSLAPLLNYSPRAMPVLIPLPNPTPQRVIPYANDRRFFNPADSSQAPSAVRTGAQRLVAGRSFNATRFADPQLVGICARRQARKEVLFAKRLTRAGSGGAKRFNFWSKVGCK